MRKLYLGNGDKKFKFADTTTEIRLNADGLRLMIIKRSLALTMYPQQLKQRPQASLTSIQSANYSMILIH